MEDSNKYAGFVLRIGMALVFYWFGIMQIINPQMFAYYVPDFVVNLVGISAQNLSFFNGISEIILATFLVFGLFTRITSILLAVHMGSITLSVGFIATGVRDFGLTIALISLALLKDQLWALDSTIKNRFSKKWQKRLLLSASSKNNVIR